MFHEVISMLFLGYVLSCGRPGRKGLGSGWSLRDSGVGVPVPLAGFILPLFPRLPRL
jgi:hypothetical protein